MLDFVPIGTGTIGFGVFDSDGSGSLDGEAFEVAAEDVISSELRFPDVFADNAGLSVLLAGKSVRLRLAVALAPELSFDPVVSGSRVGTLGSEVWGVTTCLDSV